MRVFLPALAALLLLVSPVAAQDYWKAFDIYVRGDYATALPMFRKLARQGHATAQYNLGQMYENGHGVPQDYAQALAWYRRAAAWRGFANAQHSLGSMYANGHGVTQDYLQAYMWYSFAVDLGHELAMADRADIARRMTPAQIAQAQRMTRETFPKLR